MSFGMGTLGLGPDVATQSTAVAKPSFLDQVSNVITKVVQPAANVYTQIKTNQPAGPQASVPAYTQPTYSPAPTAAPAPVQQNNTKKYLLIGGAIVLAAGTIYLVTKKKK